MASKLNWCEEEDNCLKQIRAQVHSNCWSIISKALNRKFPNRNRTGKQCRERFLNFLQFDEDHSHSIIWASEQVHVLFQNFEELGTKWSQIARSLPGKSENTLKNKFYSSLRKFLRVLNMEARSKKHGALKPIKLQSLLRFLNFSQEELNDLSATNSTKEEIKEIRTKILRLAEKEDTKIDASELAVLGQEIKQFHRENRCLLIKKCRKRQNHSKEIRAKSLYPDHKKIVCEDSSGKGEEILTGSPSEMSRRDVQKQIVSNNLQELNSKVQSEKEVQNQGGGNSIFYEDRVSPNSDLQACCSHARQTFLFSEFFCF